MYQGCWYTPNLLKGVLAFQKQFEARDTDIILASTPKAGTTWLKSLIFVIMNRDTISKNLLLTTNPHGLIPHFELDLFASDNNGSTKFLDHSSSPCRLFATHVPYTSLPSSVLTSKCRIIYICRNPKDNLVSCWHFNVEITPPDHKLISLEEAHELYCKGVSPLGPFWDHVLGYWKGSLERPENMLFLKYEELQKDINFQVKKLATYLGRPFSSKEESEGVIEEIIRMCSIEHLRNLEINKTGKFYDYENKSFFRKGEVGDWKSHFTPLMVQQLDQVNEEKLGGSGLTFNVF